MLRNTTERERERETHTHTHTTAVNLKLSTAAFEELAEELLQLCSLLLTSSRIRVVRDINCLFLHPFLSFFLFELVFVRNRKTHEHKITMHHH